MSAASVSAATHEVVIVAAIAQNGVIGKAGGLPWRLPKDLAHFKELTLGHTLIMGRRTFEEIGRKPLPGRGLVVVSRQLSENWFPASQRDSASAQPHCATTLDEAIALVPSGQIAFVAGGARLYAEALDVADRLELTRVEGAPEGDTRFPSVDWSKWRLVASEHIPPDERNAYGVTFERWLRN